MGGERERFERDLAEVDWPWLRPHARRGALILASDDLDLVTAAVAVAGDDREAVAAWIARGRLRKPSPDQAAAWEAEPSASFQVLIVQPYVLARPVRPA